MGHYSIVDFLHQGSFMSYQLSHQITSHKKLPNPFFSLPFGRPPLFIFGQKLQLHLLPFCSQKLTPNLLIFLDHHSSLKGDLEEEDTWRHRAYFLVVLHRTLGRKVKLLKPSFFLQTYGYFK